MSCVYEAKKAKNKKMVYFHSAHNHKEELGYQLLPTYFHIAV